MFEILCAFAVTEVIESCVGFLLGIRGGRNFFTVFLVNLMTNPALNISLLLLYSIFYGRISAYSLHFLTNSFILIAEIAVIFIEGFWYKKCLRNVNKSPYLLSAVMNFVSCLASYPMNMILSLIL